MADPAQDQDQKKEGRQLPFASMVEDLKEKIGQVTENKKMGADLLFMNTYMASLALADASRPEIFSFAANRKEYVSSKYIAKVDTFVKKWSYSLFRGTEHCCRKDKEHHPPEYAQPVRERHRIGCTGRRFP